VEDEQALEAFEKDVGEVRVQSQISDIFLWNIVAQRRTDTFTKVVGRERTGKMECTLAGKASISIQRVYTTRAYLFAQTPQTPKRSCVAMEVRGMAVMVDLTSIRKIDLMYVSDNPTKSSRRNAIKWRTAELMDMPL
jgi:hypothetical protein